MITATECAKCAGLGSNEVILGALESKRHRVLLSSYLLNIDKGPESVRDMIMSDLRGFLDLGALNWAADAFLVLRLFLSQHPEAIGSRGRETPSEIPNAASDPHLSKAASLPTDDPIVCFPQSSTPSHQHVRNRFHVSAGARRRGGRR